MPVGQRVPRQKFWRSRRIQIVYAISSEKKTKFFKSFEKAIRYYLKLRKKNKKACFTDIHNPPLEIRERAK